VKREDTANGNGGKPAGLVSLNRWIADVGVSRCTVWRWRKDGLLKVVNIYGKLYVSRAADEEFTRRAESGEFSQVHPSPKRVDHAGAR
jgi:hypothetical protein